MKKGIQIICVVVAGIAAAAFFARPSPQPAGSAPLTGPALIPPAGPALISPTDATLVARGKVIYASNCASCHGAKLEGQPDWRQRLPNGRLPAPPHDVTGHTWHHPDQVLVDIVKYGLVPGKTAPEGYESDMPAYGATLKDAEISAVLAYIKSTWPADALEAQRNITLQALSAP